MQLCSILFYILNAKILQNLQFNGILYLLRHCRLSLLAYTSDMILVPRVLHIIIKYISNVYSDVASGGVRRAECPLTLTAKKYLTCYFFSNFFFSFCFVFCFFFNNASVFTTSTLYMHQNWEKPLLRSQLCLQQCIKCRTE